MKFKRREITTQKEKANFKAQIREDVERVDAEKKAEKAALIEKLDRREEEARRPEESEEGWTPYETDMDVFREVARAHPTWPLEDIRRVANGIWDRYQLVRKALIEGLQKGRTLREQATYGKGWWWDSLEPLTPQERGFVIAKIRAVVTKKR